MPATRRLTVIVPLYNGERFIGTTLDSLADQSLPVEAVIVVNDGSTDRGVELARAHPVGALVIDQENAGVAVSRNRGALAAESRFVAFLDQDDVWMRRRHERIVSYLEADPDCRALATTESSFFLAEDAVALDDLDEGLHRGAVEVSAGSSSLEDLRRSRDAIAGIPTVKQMVTPQRLLQGGIGVTCSYVVERDLFFLAGGCPTSVRTMDDWLSMLNISRLSPFPLLDEPSILYRVHPGSATMSAEWALAFLTAVSAARYGGMLVSPGHARDPRQVTLSLFWRHWLLELARRDRSGLLDAVAFTRLLANADEHWIREAGRLTRTHVATELRARRARARRSR